MSSKLELQLDFKSHRPTLFVGLGGAGGTVVNRIAGILGRREDWRQIQNIYQFFVIDTDRAMIDECPHVPMARKFIISNFDKGIYVEEKRGLLSSSKTEPDPRVTQWVHDWYNFRGSQGAGAGQIRIESRLSLYNAIESTDLIKRIEDAISKTIHISNTMVDTRVKKMNVFFYFSVAGGTGSGSSLMMAALVRHIIEQFGWSAHITGVCILPTLFLPLIRNPRQRDDILANGYASIKEIEHLMKLKVTADDPLRRRETEFIYHPFIETTRINASPYDFVYIIDTTSDLYVDQHFSDVVADAIYLQMFSPIFARKDSDYDNYEKNQKRLARGLYTTHYGSFGCSLLILPDRDILEYCAIRQTADLFRTHLSGTFVAGDGKRFKPEDNPEFLDAEPEQQDAMRDEAFCRFIDHEVTREQKENVIGKKKFSRLKEKMGVSENCTYELLDRLKRLVTDELAKSEEGENHALDLLLEEAKNFEPWIQTEFLKNVWKVEKKGLDEDYEDDKLRQHKFFQLRNVWERDFHDAFIQRIDDVMSAHPTVEYEAPFERSGDKTLFRKMVIEEVTDLIKRVHKRLMDVNRDLDNQVDVISARLSGSRLLANIFSDARTNIFGQRYFSLALCKELAAREKALELLRGEFDAEKTRNEIEKFAVYNQEELEILYEEAEKKFLEMSTKTEKAKYEDAWREKFASNLANLEKRYQNFQYYSFFHKIYSRALASVKEYLSIIRDFYNNSSTPIRDLDARCAGLLKEKAEQADEYVVNEEVLRDLSGKRLWEDYYTLMVKGKAGGMASEEVMAVITNVFASDTYTNNFDRAAAIQNRFIRKCRESLKPHITGLHSSGKEQRGLLLTKGLELEAEFKFVDYLKANGFWEGWKQTYEQHMDLGESQEDTPNKVVELRDKMWEYSRNYLESKFKKCLRNSQILANLNTNDSEVVEFSCRQSMMAYDKDLYGEPEGNGRTLHFPSIIAKMSPETAAVNWPDVNTSNIVVFYSAILGAPLFCFRNIIGQCREAYNRRVEERRWDRPDEGRQYPLHVDKNWEPDDPMVDRGRLPLSPDPDEAVEQRSRCGEDMVRFFEMFVRLVHAGDIVYDMDAQVYTIPKGKLSNKKEGILLGRSPREAVITLLSAIPAHELIKARCAEKGMPPLTREDVVTYKETFSSRAQVDVWHDERLDSELEATINLIDDLLEYYDEREAKERRKGIQAYFVKKEATPLATVAPPATE